MMPRDRVVLPIPEVASRKIRPWPWANATRRYVRQSRLNGLFIGQVQGYFRHGASILQQLTNGWNQITGRPAPRPNFPCCAPALACSQPARHAASKPLHVLRQQRPVKSGQHIAETGGAMAGWPDDTRQTSVWVCDQTAGAFSAPPQQNILLLNARRSGRTIRLNLGSADPQ